MPLNYHPIIIWQAILQSKSSVLIGWFSVGILQYGPLLWKRSFLDIFFRAPAPAKFKLRKRKKKKNGKVLSWYKTGMNEVNTPV